MCRVEFHGLHTDRKTLCPHRLVLSCPRALNSRALNPRAVCTSTSLDDKKDTKEGELLTA